jgi:hypothetical protein
VKKAAQLQHMTPEQMHAQMEAARAKVARWSRSFMIFQFYTVPGQSAVAASVQMLLKTKSLAELMHVTSGARDEDTEQQVEKLDDDDDGEDKVRLYKFNAVSLPPFQPLSL